MEDIAPVKLEPGDCFVLPSGRPALIASALGIAPKLASDMLDPNRSGEVVTYNGGGDVLLVGSRFDVSDRHAEELLRTLPPLIQVTTSGEQTKLRWSIELMMQELREAQPGSSLVAQHLSHMILVQALRLYLSGNPHLDVGWFSALADPQLNASIGAMHANPSFPWTLQELAARASMSRSAFAQHFRERVGETPIAYLTRWRMILAGEKIIQGRETVAEISLSLGYESEHAFSTAFKRVMGCPPRRYARAGLSKEGVHAFTAGKSRTKMRPSNR
jgi:AraC-like DNA-binding protein